MSVRLPFCRSDHSPRNALHCCCCCCSALLHSQQSLHHTQYIYISVGADFMSHSIPLPLHSITIRMITQLLLFSSFRHNNQTHRHTHTRARATSLRLNVLREFSHIYRIIMSVAQLWNVCLYKIYAGAEVRKKEELSIIR